MAFGVDAAQREASHWLLLRTSGWVADELTSRCRLWLRQGRLVEMAHAVAYAAVAHRLRLTAADIGLLGDLLASDGADTSALEMLEVCELDPLPSHGFAPTRALAGAARAPAADVPAVGLIGAEPEDDCDRAVIRAAAQDGVVRALWRAWRFCGDTAWPPPQRVYVVETDHGVDLTAIAVTMQEVAWRAGDPHAQIEVYPGRICDQLDHPSMRVAPPPPSYQRLARDHGALLWARRPDRGMRLVAGYEVAGRMPRRSAYHPFRDEDETDRFLLYLCQGVPIERSPMMAPDVFHPNRPLTVPTTYRTDGSWIWSDAVAYYVAKYRLPPDRWFIADLRKREFRPFEVDDATVYRAWAALLINRFAG